MENVEIKCSSISKSFSGRTIFEKLDLSISSSQSLCVTGRNGSGKSTLIKILSGLLQPTRGTITILNDGAIVKPHGRYLLTGLVSPYLNLYDELTAYENLEFFSGLKSKSNGKTGDSIDAALERVGLQEKKNVTVGNFSSGMKQRLKIAFATINDPEILFLDEPRTNLDEEGIELFKTIVEDQKKKGILILATNDPDDVELCESVLNIEQYRYVRTG